MNLHTKTLAEARKIFFGIVGQTDFDLDSEETASYKAMLERKISDWKTFTTSIVSDSALSAAPPKDQDANGIGEDVGAPGALEPDQGAGISSLCQRVTLSGGYYQQAWKLNQKASLKVCSAVLDKLYSSLHAEVVSETPPSLDEFNEKYEKIKAEYDAYPKVAGPSKRHCLASLEKGIDVVSDTGAVLLSYDYRKDRELVSRAGVRNALDKVAGDAKAFTEKSVGETADRLSKEAHEMVAMAEVHMAKEIAERFGELESSLTAKIETLTASLGESQKREEALQNELEAVKSQMAVSAERAKERHEWISKRQDEFKESMEARAAESRENAAALSARCESIGEDLASVKASAQQQAVASAQQFASLAQTISTLETQIASIKENTSSALTAHEGKLGALDEKFANTTASAQSLSDAVDKVKAAIAAAEASHRDASEALRADIETIQAKADSLTKTQAESEVGFKEEFEKTKEQIKDVIQKLAATVKARGDDIGVLKTSMGEHRSGLEAQIVEVQQQLSQLTIH